MAVSKMDVVVLSSNHVDTHGWVQQLLKEKSSRCPALTAFVAGFSDILREELASLPSDQRGRLPVFGSLVTFYNEYASQEYQLESINSSILCLGQLAHWIRLQEEMPDALSSNKCILGQGLGLLAASAISTFSSMSSFIPTALECARLAFHLGSTVDQAANRLSFEDGGVWSKKIAASGKVDLQQLLFDQKKSSTRPITNLPYISSELFSEIIVSGAPDALSDLFAHQSIKKHFLGDLKARGVVCAPHIYGAADIEACSSGLGKSITGLQPVFPLLSGFERQNGGPDKDLELLRQAVQNILYNVESSTEMVKQLETQGQGHALRLIPVGPSSHTQSLASDLTKEGFEVAVFETSYESMLRKSPPGSACSGQIAIVGMSGRFPGAQNTDEFWEMLMQGLDMHTEVPADRFDAQAHFDPTGKGRNKSHTPFGCFIKDAGLFDPRFFNMSPREAMQTDPMQRLAIITAYEALEMSGYVANRTASTKLDRIGTFYGQTSDDWREINEAQDIDTYFITGGVRAFGPGRINYFFKFSGPSYSVDTACSSSMAALQIACTALQAKECDTAITGGLNVLTNPDIFSGLSKGQFLSKTGNCQTFDDDADGYCRGDGVGTVILKRMEDAIADNDNILATILATATNHSADAVSITHPHAETQETLYRHILSKAGVDALDIGYVEMHGTGTQAGDATEMTSVLNVFAPPTRQRAADQPLYLGSVKSNIGHGEAASGVCALIKVLLMMRNNMIPPHCGIKGKINHTFPKDMLARKIFIPKAPTPFSGYGKKRTIYVSNFSAAGGNSGIILQDPSDKPVKKEDPRKSHVVAVSARALSSLHANLQNLADYIESNPGTPLASLGYTTTARRTHHNYKISFDVSCMTKLRSALEDAADKTVEPTAASPHVIFTYTGQGSHYLGLAGELYKTSRKFQTELSRANSIAVTLGFPDFLPLIQEDGVDLESMPSTMIQVGLVSIQMALTELWSSWGIKPDLVIGHSLGEYSALYAAGVLSMSETINLVGTRARLLELHCKPGTHAMLAVNTSYNALDGILKSHPLEIACINGPSEVVLSGTDQDIEIAKESLSASGTRCKKLNISYAFHSTQVDAILQEFRDCSSTSFKSRTPKVPILSPLLGGLMTDPITPDYLCNHARKTVNFLGALKAGRNEGVIKSNSIFIELGPQPVTLAFVKSTLGSSVLGAGSLNRKDSNWTSITKAASLLYNNGARINWDEFHQEFEPDLDLLDLPRYSWSLKKYWIDYVGNWCLSKGSDLPLPAIQEPELSTTTVQRIIKESYYGDGGQLVAESDIDRPDLLAAISGHKVNGIALCPSSLYGDVAITIGAYMHKKIWKESLEDFGRIINVRAMECPKPLIAKAGTEQVLRIEAQADKQTQSVKISFHTGNTEHAHCTVDFEEREDQELKWSRSAYLVEDRMKAVQTRAAVGEAHVLLSSIAYQLFASLVDYDAPYRGMKRVIFDTAQLEATAEISLYKPHEDESFVCAPYWLDSIGHLAGFCVNAMDSTEAQEHVYISHGWESLRLSETLVPQKSYTTYVRMLSGGGHVMVGDVYLFDEGRIIGLFGGLKFQRIPRRVLDIMLPPANGQRRSMPKALDESAPVAATVKKTVVEIPADKIGQRPILVSQTVAVASVTSQVLDIVAQECGVAMAELADSNQFSDLGVDSLMQLAISGRIREDVGLDIHSTLFVDCPTIISLKQYLVQFETSGTPSDGADSSDSGRRSSVDPPSTDSTATTPTSEAQLSDIEQQSLLKDAVMALTTAKRMAPARKAQSFILSGSIKTATRFLFMIPDGGGAAISYMHIPTLSKDVCVFGLNSPFMEDPEEYDCGVTGIAAMFVEEIQRRQPHGPYDLGGWSAGGVIAYEITQQLIRAKEEVSHLVLLDSPCPLIIEPLPYTLHAWFNSIGLIGDPNNPGSTKVPAWLLPHFSSTIRALSAYGARKMMRYDTGLPIPKTTAIWCREGICHGEDAPRPDPYPYGHAQWLLEDHDDFEDGGWDALLGKGTVQGRIVPGNHFTMMQGEAVHMLATEIRRALEIEA